MNYPLRIASLIVSSLRRAPTPASYQIDMQRGLVLTTAVGVLTMTDVVAHRTRLLNDPDFSPELSHLIDFAGVTALDVSSADVAQFAKLPPMFSGRSRLAWVVTKPAVFGMMRMYAAYYELEGGSAQPRIFSSREEALQWLLSPGQRGEEPPQRR